MKGTSLTSTTPVLVNICLKLLLNKIHKGPLVLPLVLRQALWRQEQMSIGKHPKQDLPYIMILKFELFVCLFSCVNWVKKIQKKANVPKNIHGSKLIPNGLFGQYHDYCLPKF